MNNRTFNGEAFGEFPQRDHETFGIDPLIVGHALDHARKPRTRNRWRAKELLRKNRELDGITLDEAKIFMRQIDRIQAIEVVLTPDYAETKNIKPQAGGFYKINGDGDWIDEWKIGKR